MANRLNKSRTVQAARKPAKSRGRPQRGDPTAPTVRRKAASGRSTATSRRGGGGVEPTDREPGARRIRGVAVGFAVAAAVLVAQAAHLQLFQHERLAAEGRRQAMTTALVVAKRGAIRDRNGHELATTVDVDSVFYSPSKGQRRPSPNQVEALAKLLGRPAHEVERRIGMTRQFSYLARRVDAATAGKVTGLAIPGVGTKPEAKRFYANIHLASHVLGFTNVDGEGRAGIERAFDDQLKGRQQAVAGRRDAFGQTILSEGTVAQVALRGADVELTLDRHIQYAAEEALAEAVGEHRAKTGVALVLDPKTGEVLALASYPHFNPNNLRDTTVFQRTNRAVNAVFEPGSTLKMVTVAAALEERTIAPHTVLDCENGRWSVGPNEIHDADHRFGTLTISEVIQKSSNICAAKIGFRLGRRSLHGWLERFGFGQKTGIELPGELRGLIRPPSAWSDIALANIAFGQGVSVTPIQLIQAAATIANGGIRVPPRLVRAVVGPDGRRIEAEPPAPKRVVSAATAAALAKMMVKVTEPDGTAHSAAIPGFRVAGKTGTAQKIDPVSRAYSHERFVSSFVGFVPADDPELVALILIDEPKGSIYGGVVAAPSWRKMAIAALTARGRRPEDPEAWRAFRAEQAPPAPLPVASRADAVHGEAAPRGESPVPTEAGPNLAATLDLALSDRAQRLLGLADPGRTDPNGRSGDRMPNFARLTLREVLNRAADTRCDLAVAGTGRVVRQDPAAGAPLAPNARCELTLAPRR